MAAPNGNKFAANALEAKKALERALSIRSGDVEPTQTIERFRVLVDIWDKQIAAALAGELDSAKFIVERLDGKPTQPIDANVNLTGHEEWLDKLS